MEAIDKLEVFEAMIQFSETILSQAQPSLNNNLLLKSARSKVKGKYVYSKRKVQSRPQTSFYQGLTHAEL